MKEEVYLLGLKLGMFHQEWTLLYEFLVLSFGIDESDNCLYQKQVDGQLYLLCLYMDDILILASDLNLVNDVKNFLSHHFDIKDLGKAELILGMKIIRTNNLI